jgi:hypothetical protein
MAPSLQTEADDIVRRIVDESKGEELSACRD